VIADQHLIQTAQLAGVSPAGAEGSSLVADPPALRWPTATSARPNWPNEKTRTYVIFCALNDIIEAHRTTTDAARKSFVNLLDSSAICSGVDTAFNVCFKPLTFGSTEGAHRQLPAAARAIEGELSPETLFEAIEDLPVEAPQSKAFTTLSDLRRWLHLSVAEAATLVGFGRTTPSSWLRAGHEPQPARARRLYQAHAIVSALVRRIGQEETLRWFLGGSPSPSELITQGDIEAAADSAEEILIGRQARRGPAAGALLEENVEPPSGGLRPSVRRRNRRKAS
jgi:hypothetical protein